MRNSRICGAREKRMTSLRFHEQPSPIPAYDNVSIDPVPISMRLSLSSAKNAAARPSGDQHGYFAPSVPANVRDTAESSERSHKRDRPSDVATNRMLRPSGEIAIETGSVVAGVVMSSRICGADEPV